MKLTFDEIVCAVARGTAVHREYAYVAEALKTAQHFRDRAAAEAAPEIAAMFLRTAARFKQLADQRFSEIAK